MKRLIMAFCALLFAASAFAGGMYRWVDNHGVVHYSDQPHAGSSQVDLPGLSRYQARPVSTESADESSDTAAKQSVPDTFKIVSPSAEQTVHANDGKVSVAVELDPPLSRGETLRYEVDGKKVGETPSGSITLTNIVRGTHTLTAAIINRQGDVVATAPTVTFHVRHQSQLNPQRHNANQMPRGLVP